MGKGQALLLRLSRRKDCPLGTRERESGTRVGGVFVPKIGDMKYLGERTGRENCSRKSPYYEKRSCRKEDSLKYSGEGA